MPRPLSGLVAVAEYGSLFEADLAVGQLRDAGIEATTSYDPALNTVVRWHASDRVVEVVVRAQDVESALDVLVGVEEVELPPEFTDPEAETAAPSKGVARWGVIVGWSVVVMLGVALVVAAVQLVLERLDLAAELALAAVVVVAVAVEVRRRRAPGGGRPATGRDPFG